MSRTIWTLKTCSWLVDNNDFGTVDFGLAHTVEISGQIVLFRGSIVNLSFEWFRCWSYQASKKMTLMGAHLRQWSALAASASMRSCPYCLYVNYSSETEVDGFLDWAPLMWCREQTCNCQDLNEILLTSFSFPALQQINLPLPLHCFQVPWEMKTAVLHSRSIQPYSIRNCDRNWYHSMPQHCYQSSYHWDSKWLGCQK